MTALRIDDGPPEMTPAPIRIDVWRAGRVLLLALVIPMTAAVAVDLTLGTLPFAVIAAVVVCIPLSTILVSRTVLAEFDRVIAAVAPAVPDEQAPESGTPAEGTPAEEAPAEEAPAEEAPAEEAPAVGALAGGAAAQRPGLALLEQGQDAPGDAGVSRQAR